VTPLTPVGFASTTSRLTQTRSKGADKQTPAQKADKPAQGGTAAPQKAPAITTSLTAAEISATKTDTIVGDTLGDGKAQAGDTVKYTITVQNNSATETATGVVLNDTVDTHTTIVTDSIHAQPQARNDSYNAVGNTLLEAGLAAASGNPAVTSAVKVFANDSIATDAITLVSFQATSAQGGTVTLNADGSFSYLPAVNFTGTDTFTYTVRNSNDATLTDTATVTITVANRVWYVNNAAAAGGDGRASSPFQTLTPVNGAGGVGDADAAGDYIYLFTGNATYTTGLILETSQTFVGNGVALVVPVASVPTTLRAAGTRPTLTNNAGNALVINNNTTTQGLNLTAANNSAIVGSGISGTINVSDANVTTTGTGFGVNLTGQTGTFNYSGGTSGSSIAGNSSNTAVVISGGSGNITFFGVPISQNGGRVVDIQTRTGGTVEFSNGSTVTQTAGAGDSVVLRNNTGTSVINFLNNVNLTTGSGRGLYTDNSTGNFTLNMNAGGNNITATGGAAIDVEDIVADLDFVNLTSINSVAAGGANGIRIFNLPNTPAGRSITVTGTTQVTNSAGTGVLVDSNAAAVSFATLNSAPATNQIGVSITSNSGTISATGGTVTTTDAVAVNVLNSPLGTTTLTSVSTDNTGDTDRGVSLDGLTGTLTINGGSLVGGNASAFYANAQNGNITYNGTISQANAFRLIEVTNKTGGTVAFGSALTATNGAVAGAGVFLNANTGTTFNFTGGLNLSTGAGNAFTATGGGTVNATQNNTTIINTLTTTTGTALNVANTNIGASGLTFRSISSNGAPNGIVLNTTGAAGGLTVTGSSSGQCGGAVSGSPLTITTAPNIADCTGGIIQSSTGAGILLTSTSNVSLTRMRIINGGDDGVFGTSVTGFTLATSLIDNNGNAVEEAGLDFTNLLGTSSVTNSTIRLSHENNIEVRNNTNNGSQATLTVTGCAITNASAKTQSDDGILYEMAGTSNGSVTADGNVLTANRGDHLQAAGKDTSTLRAIFKNNNLTGGHSTALGADIVVNGAAYGGSGSVLYDIDSNRINGAILSAITTNLGVPSNGVTMSGHVRNNTIGTTGVIRSCSAQANGIAIDAHGAGTHTVSVTGNTMRQCKDRGINVTANDSVGGNLFLTVQSNTVLEGSPINPAGFPADGTGGREGFNLIAGSTATDTIFICAQIGGAGALANNFNRGPEGVISGLQDIRIKKQTTAVITIRLPGYAGSATDASAFVAANNTSSEDGSSTATASATSSGTGGGGFTGGAACATPPASPIADQIVISQSATLAQSVAAHDAAVAAAARAVPVQSDLTSANAPRFIGAAVVAVAKPVAGVEAQAKVKRDQDEAHDTTRSKTPDIQPYVSAFPINIGTLTPGESVTITFSVKIADVLPQPVSQISNQGMITGSNFSGTVLTDDPSVAGTNNPTVTPILGLPNVEINDASTREPSSGSAPMPFTVTLSHAYGSPVSVNFSTADGTATAGTDYTSTSGTLNFAPTERIQTIDVPVLADGDASETDETFTATLNTPVNGYLGADPTATGTITVTGTPGTVLISELRTSGPAGANDEFVELYNNTDATIDISGWTLVTSGAACGSALNVVALVPAATTIPARGHYLITGTTYSLPVTGDLAMVNPAQIDDNANVGIFDTSNVVNYSTTTRRDAVGFGGNSLGNCALLREGATLPAANSSTSQYSFVRSLTSGTPKDTGDNATDFIVVSTTPETPVGNNVSPNLGAPGAETRTSPIQRNATIKSGLIDPTAQPTASPNRIRSAAGANPTNAAFGTLDIRRKFTNSTGSTVTSLRFRAVDMTTRFGASPPPVGTADLRLLTSTDTTANGGTIIIKGTTLDAPAQPNGGGLNSSVTVAIPGGLVTGASINLRFLLGVQQEGAFRFLVNVEALPGPAGIAEEATGTSKAGTTGKQRSKATAGGAAEQQQQQ
jgi:hypothetical protein